MDKAKVTQPAASQCVLAKVFTELKSTFTIYSHNGTTSTGMNKTKVFLGRSLDDFHHTLQFCWDNHYYTSVIIDSVFITETPGLRDMYSFVPHGTIEN